MHVAVTGGAGLIGSQAVDLLLRHGHRVTAILLNPILPDGSNLQRTDDIVIGDAADPAVLGRVIGDADVVLHLAAIPAPVGYSSLELLRANTMTTMAVLEAAGTTGSRGVVLASSISALGMAWADQLMEPLELPISEAHPLRPTEGYALSKECDEAVARMAHRRWALPITAFRFPFTHHRSAIEARAAEARPETAAGRQAAQELWAYLDLRDAATACLQALEATATGDLSDAAVVNVIADDALLDEPLAALMNTWFPTVDSSALTGRRCAYTTEAAEVRFGFRARHLLHPPATSPDQTETTRTALCVKPTGTVFPAAGRPRDPRRRGSNPAPRHRPVSSCRRQASRPCAEASAPATPP